MKKFIVNFLKGIVVGVGGIAPGLSGSVMLILLGLYEKAIRAIGTLFKNFKKNVMFLVPLVLGFACGILLFSKVVDFMLVRYEFVTRYLFLGLVLGTVPLFYKQVKKRGFSKKMYVLILASVMIGLFLFSYKSLFPRISDPNLLQSTLLGVAVAGSSIVPGVDSAVILSTLGLYELYVTSIATLNFSILLPAGVGLLIGAVLISVVMNFLIKHFYIVTFSVIFGLFLSIIPNVLNESCVADTVPRIVLAIVVACVGFCFSFYLGSINKKKKH